MADCYANGVKAMGHYFFRKRTTRGAICEGISYFKWTHHGLQDFRYTNSNWMGLLLKSCIDVAWYNFHISHKQKIVSAALSLVFILDITKKEESAKHALFRNHDSLQKILYSKLILTFIKLCTLKYPTLASSAFVYPEGFAYLNILDATFVCTLST